MKFVSIRLCVEQRRDRGAIDKHICLDIAPHLCKPKGKNHRAAVFYAFRDGLYESATLQGLFAMSALHTFSQATYLIQIFTAVFLAILFLQSGVDKVVDRRGNLEWLKGHFAKSPLAGVVSALVTAITILELAAGVLSAVGCLALIVLRDSIIAFYGAVISAVAIIALFFGQRMAKEYAGAAVLVPYFLLTLVAIYLLAQR